MSGTDDLVRAARSMALSNLCLHDRRNPDGCSCHFLDPEECPGDECGACDACHSGRARLADTLLRVVRR